VCFDNADGNVPGADADVATAVVKDANSVKSASSTSDPVAMLVASVAKQLRPDKERACELRRIFAGGFVGVARRVWPGLRAVRMLATGGFAAHARLLADTYMRGVAQFSLVHAASEGFYGVNVTAVDNEGPKSLGPNSRYTVLPQLGFYEFIALADVEQNQPSTVFAEQVSLERQTRNDHSIVMHPNINVFVFSHLVPSPLTSRNWIRSLRNAMTTNKRLLTYLLTYNPPQCGQQRLEFTTQKIPKIL